MPGVIFILIEKIKCNYLQRRNGHKNPTECPSVPDTMNEEQFVHDHVFHFSHLHALNWLDVVSRSKANSVETSSLGSHQDINRIDRNNAGQ
ncbi:nickel-dependent hydrogenase large subunit [Bacillus sp. FJAT-27445]|uniref:nickel-dependent hydrogenase large subunit n=1 Tax=Bacillus sp. FJAT-27445 TaxID=1679166 RepID=UPI003462A309